MRLCTSAFLGASFTFLQAFALPCENCNYEIHHACSHCPNCGASLSRIKLDFIPSQRVLFEASSQQEFSASAEFFTAPDPTSPLTLCPSNVFDPSHRLIRNKLQEARLQNNKNLWYELLQFLSKYKNDSYVQLVKAICLRKLEELLPALNVLEDCISELNVHSSNLSSTNINMLYEAAFVTYLLHQYDSSVYYYYYYFFHVPSGAITVVSFEQALNSAKKILARDTENNNALALLGCCWEKLKDRIHHSDLSFFHERGFH